MNYLVNIADYTNYVSKYGNDRLDNNHKIWVQSKGKLFKQNEIFDSGGYITNYSNMKVGDNYLIKFKTNSTQEYRFDLINDIKNSNVYHLAFSTSDKETTNIEYEKLTDMKESIEILNRLMWIISDLSLNCEYCIGATGTKKDIIYKYMLKNINGWEKRVCDYYELGWGIYFTI